MKRAASFAPLQDSRSGMVLVVVMCLAMVVGVLAAVLFTASTTQAKSARRYIRLEQAFYIAEAGIEHAAAVIDANSLTNVPASGLPGLTNAVFFAGGSFRISAVSSNPGSFVVRSTGTYANVSRAIEVSLSIPPASGSIIPPSVDAPLAYYGTNHSLTLIGAGGKIDGNDYDVPASFNCSGANCFGNLTTNPACGSSVYTDNTLSVAGLNQIAAPPPPRLQTGGGTLTEADWMTVVNQLIPLANLTITNSVSYAGNTMPIGTRASPTITVVKSNGVLNITGTIDGAGIMILEEGAQFVMGGTYHYEGLVIALGSSVSEIAGHGTPKISGAVVCLGNGGNVSSSGAGGVIRYSSAALANLANIGAFANTNRISLAYWREVK